MDASLVEKLNYAFVHRTETHPLPLPLKDALQLVSDFFRNNGRNKLCLVLPSKELTAQWLLCPFVLSQISDDYIAFSDEMSEKYKDYKRGEKLLLNNKAIVEWAGIRENGVAIRTKSVGESSGAEFVINFTQVTKLQKAPPGKETLSPLKKVQEVLPTVAKIPIEQLLGINTKGNMGFIKNSVCLVGKFNRYESAMGDIRLNNDPVESYFRATKIEDGGKVDEHGPCFITRSYLNFLYFLETNPPVSTVIIDGFSSISERITDFADADRKYNIPTILITDISESDSFDQIAGLGFEFFNFTREFLSVTNSSIRSPFWSFDAKLKKYISFQVKKYPCTNTLLEEIAAKLHALPDKDDDNRLTQIRIGLIQLFNLLSRICHEPTEKDLGIYKQKIGGIETLFQNGRLWLEGSVPLIDAIIACFKTFVENLETERTGKSLCLSELLTNNRYQFIICPTIQEVKDLTDYFRRSGWQDTARIISVSDINDQLLSDAPAKAILTAWPRSQNMSRILTSFVLSELTVLFYGFEDRYYNSLQNKKLKLYQYSKSTVDKKGTRLQSTSAGFDHLCETKESSVNTINETIDITEFELSIDTAQYSIYKARNNAESVRARRIDLENNRFIYATDSHKFILINEFRTPGKKDPAIIYKKPDSMHPGDVIAFINTERDILVDLVRKSARPEQFAAVKQFTDLWKTLLREYYVSIGSDHKRIVAELRNYGCLRHEATIRTWLQDENLIGPDDDADLICIAQLTGSDTLRKDLGAVRKAIDQMIKWRFQASELVREKIKENLASITNQTLIDTSVDIPDLGKVTFLKVTELKKETESIDKKYVHKLLTKESS
jgi:hypothetical protein